MEFLHIARLCRESRWIIVINIGKLRLFQLNIMKSNGQVAIYILLIKTYKKKQARTVELITHKIL